MLKIHRTFVALGMWLLCSWTWTGKVVADEPQAPRELHVVCVYEGSTRTGAAIHGERATVSVERPGKSVVLFLGACSDHSVTWDIVVIGKETKLESVILGGQKKQAVKELPEGTKLVEAFGRDRNSLMGYYKLTGAQTRRLIRQLVDRTELPVSSYYGVYQPKGTIQVTEVRNDPKLDPDFPKVDPKEKFPETSFPAVHFVPGRYPHETAATVGEYTLQGALLDTLKTVKGQYAHFAFDPDAKQWYGMKHGVFSLDLKQQTATELPLDADVPKFSWPCGLAFDSKRKRLVVATHGGEGFLYEYSLADKKWSVFASLNNLDLSNLCYSPHHDGYFSVMLDYDGNSHAIPTLIRLNAAGAVISRERLIGPFVDGMLGSPHGGEGGVQLLPLGEQLVLISNSSGYDPNDGSRSDPATFIFHVDPKLGFARLSFKSSGNKTKPKASATDDEDTSRTEPAERRTPTRVSKLPSVPNSTSPSAKPQVALKKNDAAELRFHGPFFPAQTERGQSNGSWGEFTLTGPDLNTLRPMPKGIVRMAFDAEKKQFYGLNHHEVFQVDLVKQTATELEIGTDAPKLSWPSGITFDSKRRRLLVLGSGLIYQCDVDKEHKWSVLREVHRHWAQGRGLVYEPQSDALFLLSQTFGAQPAYTLARLDSEGNAVKTKSLAGPDFAGAFGRSPADNNSHLIAVEGKLVLLAYPREHGDAQPPARSRMFLYDPKTDRVQMTWEN